MKNYSKFYSQVKHYTEIAEKFCKAYLKEFRGNGYFSTCEFEEDQIAIRWEDSWAYGGYKQGAIYFPIHRLDDWEVYLQELIEKNKEEELLREQKEKEYTEKLEKAEFEKLKKKYEKA